TAWPRTLPGRAIALADALREAGLVDDARLSSLVAVRAMVAIGQAASAADELAHIGRPRKGGRLDIRLFWRLAQAEVAGALGRPAEASRRLTTGLAELHRHRGQLGSLDLQTGTAVHGWDLAQVGLSAALSRGKTADVYRWAERARAQTLLLPAVRPPDEPDTAAMLESLRQTRHELRQAELSGTPAGALRTRSDALQRKLREHSWAATGTVTVARYAPFAAVKAELIDAAMIIYLPDAARLRALVVLGGGAKLIDLGPYAEAENALLRLRGDLDASAGRAMPQRLAMAVAAATRHDAVMLARAILGPILGLVGDRELVVVPTGILVTVPWAVLPGCAQRPVTVAPSATAWWAARNRLRTIDYRSASAATLIVAGPGNDRGEAELREIAALRSNSTTLSGPSATPAATLAALENVTIAHIAAHGRHEADNALFSALELSGGPLMGYDLQRLGSTPAIVVLSSCDLGLSDVRPGDETLGMVTALLSIGSSTVVASVSRIGDETAMAVMSAYHKGIRAGRPSPVALADAGGLIADDVAGNVASFVCFGAG
ncbi:MAG TPA: CHAT domain-containing protein, partial [Candidatus Limnocylindrales bacterium]|nr:CHAT domain-containing protein [Candidatus Limnocylindrales bacterium]